MAGDELVPSELLRPAEIPGPSLIAPPGRGTPVPGLTATPTCLATSPGRGAAPPAHARLVCFVCCMMSLLFPYLLFAPGGPATSFLAHRQLVALIPYIPRTLARCKASGFTFRSDATRTAFEPFLWCHPRKQNGHTRHLVAMKVGAVVFATNGRKRRSMWARNGARRSRLPHVPDPASATSQGDLRTSCLAAHSVRQVGSADRQSPLNPDAHGCRSSDRAGRCCVHRPGRGRSGRREGE